MIFGKYQLLDQIAKGGMAEIFKAKSYGVEGFEKILVIKRILPFFSSDEKFVEMFVNEAKIAVSLNHANIVQIYDLGKAGEYYFIAMEYINGPDLSKIIENCEEQNSVIPLEIALFITSEIAKGLDYAHRQVDSNNNSLNIIHRDISPQNILLSTEGEVKITDFGIAKAKNAFMAEITQTINGNFSYMSPEQARGLSQDSRTDIFSTGAVLYKMLTGKNPLKKEPSSLIVDVIKKGEIIPPLQLMEGTKKPIPVKINDLILKALEFDPDKRFQTAAELYNDLIEFSVESEFRITSGTLADFVKKHHNTNIKTHPLHSINPGPGITGSILEKHFHGNDSEETFSKSEKQSVNKIEAIGSILKNIYILYINFENPVSKNLFENILNIISLTGGRQLEVTNNRITAGYGASGRGTPSQDAALSALNILNLLKIKDDIKANMPGISICHGELIVDSDESIKISGKYENVLNNCITLATRLPLGKIRVDETTKSAIKSNFIVREIKDGKNTIPFIELQGINTNDIINKKLINRIDDLKKIGKLLAEVNDGNGRVLTICGLPGIGKTRIALEVKRRLTTGGHSVNWFQADLKGSLSKRPYSGLVEIFRSIFNIPVYADTDLIKEKILSQKEIKLPTHEFNTLVELIKNGTITDNHNDNFGDSIKNTLIRCVKELAATSLSIFFFDNFKLIDNQSLEALHRLSQFITVLPVVLAFSIRKGYIHGFESSPQLVEIELNTLTENEIKELGAAYPDNIVNSQLNNDIYKVSMGIPACAINYIESTINSGAQYIKSENVYDNSINPVNKPSIQQQELVCSEFFTLPPEKQIILQYASVLGINFSIELLTALLEFPSEEIEAAIKVMTSFLWFSQKGTSYKFSSPFIQQTIYLTIPRDEQLLMHKNSALAIEEKFRNRKNEFAEELAYHYHNLKAYAEAIESLELAAVYYSTKGDFFKAAKCIIRAINISLKNRQNESKKIIQLLEKSISFAIHTQFLKTIEEITVQIDKLPNININPELFIRFNIAKAHIYLHTGQFAQAEELLKLAEKNAGIISNNSLLSAIHQIHGQLFFEKGDIQKSISSLMLSIGTVDTSEHSMLAHKRSLLSLGRTILGEPKNVNQIREELSKYINSNVGEEGAAAFYLQRTLYHALRLNKNYSEALNVCNSAIENAEKFSLKNDLAVYQMELADILLESGELNKAYEALEKSSEFANLASHKTMIERNNINSYYIDTIKFGSQKSKNNLIKMTNSLENGWVAIKACYLCGLIYKKDNKTGKSKKMFKKAKELSAKYGLNLYISTIDRQLKNIN